LRRASVRGRLIEESRQIKPVGSISALSRSGRAKDSGSKGRLFDSYHVRAIDDAYNSEQCEDMRAIRLGLAKMDLGGNGFSLEPRLGVPEVINICC
jgi:hypothetical protein